MFLARGLVLQRLLQMWLTILGGSSVDDVKINHASASADVACHGENIAA